MYEYDMNTVSPPVVRLFRDEIAEIISKKFDIESSTMKIVLWISFWFASQYHSRYFAWSWNEKLKKDLLTADPQDRKFVHIVKHRSR
jgi:hypothetical protein